ncbi:hypothetical protein QF025_000097 [Paraburkholderia graminis]|uniref:Uncharacterized protein n=1 Tax=Paraburkholderia graminis TaxID=60548 RepID=A0ABD5C820_9BURK|nr:hypothetical protein [Paraburkholderia graminis]
MFCSSRRNARFSLLSLETPAVSASRVSRASCNCVCAVSLETSSAATCSPSPSTRASAVRARFGYPQAFRRRAALFDFARWPSCASASSLRRVPMILRDRMQRVRRSEAPICEGRGCTESCLANADRRTSVMTDDVLPELITNGRHTLRSHLKDAGDGKTIVGRLLPLAKRSRRSHSDWQLTAQSVSKRVAMGIDGTCLTTGRGFSIAATRTSNHSGTYREDSTTPCGRHARIAFITVSEPSSLITRFMLYASTCKLISVLTRSMVRVRK